MLAPVCTAQRDKANAADDALHRASFRARDQLEQLVLGIVFNRQDQPTALVQLLQQRRWHRGGRGGDENTVLWRGSGPAK